MAEREGFAGSRLDGSRRAWSVHARPSLRLVLSQAWPNSIVHDSTLAGQSSPLSADVLIETTGGPPSASVVATAARFLSIGRSRRIPLGEIRRYVRDRLQRDTLQVR